MLTESGIFALPKIPTFPSFNIAAFWKPISFKVLPSHFSWSKSILVIMEISESNRFTGSYLPPIPISNIAKSSCASEKISNAAKVA